MVAKGLMSIINTREVYTVNIFVCMRLLSVSSMYGFSKQFCTTLVVPVERCSSRLDRCCTSQFVDVMVTR